MADNVTSNPGAGGYIFKTDEDTGATAHVPVTKIELGQADSFDGYVGAGNGMPVLPDNFISTVNTTTSPLGISANYTGTAEDVSGYSSVTISIYADVASATDGMTFQFCDESGFTNPDTYTFTQAAGEFRRFQFPVTAQYFRVNYTNGGTGQTTFRVQTILHANNILTSIHRLVDATDPDRSAQLVKAALIAQQAGTGDFVAVQTTATGNLKTSLEEYDGVPVGGGVESGALRVTIANDSTGVLSVDDNGVNLSVDFNGTNPAFGGGAESGALLVTLANDSTGVLSVDDNGNNLSIDFAGTIPTLNTGAVDAGTQRVTIATDDTVTVDNGGTFAVQSTLQTGSSLVGDVGISGARTSGGTTLYKNIDVDETAAGSTVKGSAGQIYWIHAMNLSNAKRYLKIYNQTSVTVGTTVPDLTFPLATQGDTNGAGFTLAIPNGIAFGTGIIIAATTGVADNDSGAPGANEVVVNIGYA